MSAAVAFLRKLWTRDVRRTDSSETSASPSPSTPQSHEAFPSLPGRRGSGSNYSNSTGATTTRKNRLTRALSAKLRGRREESSAHGSLDSRQPKPSYSTLSLNKFRGWRNKSTGNILSNSETLRSSVSHPELSQTNYLPPFPVDALGFGSFIQSPLSKATHLTVPSERAGPSRQPSTRSLSAINEGTPQKQRAHSLPAEALLGSSSPLPSKLQLDIEDEIKAHATPIRVKKEEPIPTPVASLVLKPEVASVKDVKAQSSAIDLPGPQTEVNEAKDQSDVGNQQKQEETVPQETLLEMLATVEERLAKLNYGATNLAVSYSGVSPAFVWSLLGWDAQRSGEHPTEYSPPSHPVYESMLAERSRGLERVRELDVETNPPGRLPGTVTVEGLSWERWELASRGRRQTVYFSQGALPPVSGPELVRKLQTVKRPLEIANAAQEAEALRQIMGQTSAAFLDWENPYNSQAGDILRVLNREDLFEDFTMSDSIYLLAMGPPPDGMGIRLFMLQVLLGYELYLRLKICDNAAGFPGFTQQTNAAILMAQRWVDNVSVEILDTSLKAYSNVHKEQVDGLIAFAEALEWPYIDEIKAYAPTAYNNHLDGKRIDVHFLDWLFGTIVPGRWWAWKIMCAALYSSASLRKIGTTPYFEAGLVLENVSYWRQRTPLAKVCGALPNVKGVGGWVGPCPVVKTVGTSENWIGWLRIHANPAEFTIAAASMLVDDRTEDDHELQDRGLRPRDGESPKDLLRDLADMTKWMLPPPPAPSTSVAKLKEIKLTMLPLEDSQDHTGQQAEATVVFEFESEEEVQKAKEKEDAEKNMKTQDPSRAATPLAFWESNPRQDYFGSTNGGSSGRVSLDLDRQLSVSKSLSKSVNGGSNNSSRHSPSEFGERLRDGERLKDVSPSEKGKGKSPVVSPLPPAPKAEEVEEEKAAEPKSKLSVEYPILYNSVFVSSPPCVSGPHLAHVREHERYKNVVDVKDLQDYEPDNTKLLIINATGGEASEALARAWCCWKGKNAVIRRASEGQDGQSGVTCITCAFNTAENLELNTLIWC